MPQEHINNRYEGTVTLERFLIKKSDLAKIGMAALGEEILTRDIINIEVLSKYDDNDNPKVIRVYRGCTAVDYSENFRVGAISGENATFQYLSCDRGDSDSTILNNLYDNMSDYGKAYFRASNYSDKHLNDTIASPATYMDQTIPADRASSTDTSGGGSTDTSGGGSTDTDGGDKP